MASASSPEDDYASDQQSEPCGLGSYSPSAGVSESESSSDLSGRRLAADASTSSPILPPAGAAASTAVSGAASRVRSCSPLLPAVGLVFWDGKLENKDKDFSEEVEMMKERFAKLLLGEDMSGGGKGVCSALAISNAITNLSATVFGELWRLEPLAVQKKAMWRREMEWLLCVSDSIVELIPSVQEFPGGGNFEVMVSKPREDLHLNLPALKKLDAMLLGMLDGFRDNTEFWYVDRGILVGDGDEGGGDYPSSSFGRPSLRQEDKWWLPCPRVPPNGLSEEVRKRLQQCRDCANQILKAAMAINSGVLAEMEIPHVYFETLPKSGKSCLGEIIYRYLTADQFSPECLLDCLDLSSEHHTLEIANRIEAAIHVWRLKGQSKSSQSKAKKASWSGKVKGLISANEKNWLLADRAEGLLLSLRLRYPGLPQTLLDMNKIQYNKDVGQSILESYSRVMESLAFNIIARIDDVIFIDDALKKSAAAETVSIFNRGGMGLPIQKRISPSPFSIQNSPYASPFATPAFCSATPVNGSPARTQPSLSKGGLQGGPEEKVNRLISSELEKVWSYAGNISMRNDSTDVPPKD